MTWTRKYRQSWHYALLITCTDGEEIEFERGGYQACDSGSTFSMFQSAETLADWALERIVKKGLVDDEQGYGIPASSIRKVEFVAATDGAPELVAEPWWAFWR